MEIDQHQPSPCHYTQHQEGVPTAHGGNGKIRPANSTLPRMEISSNNTSKATPSNDTKSAKMKHSTDNRKRNNMMIGSPSSRGKTPSQWNPQHQGKIDPQGSQ